MLRKSWLRASLLVALVVVVAGLGFWLGAQYTIIDLNEGPFWPF